MSDLKVTLQSAKIGPAVQSSDALYAALHAACDFYLEIADPSGAMETRRIKVNGIGHPPGHTVRLAGWQVEQRGEKRVLVARLHIDFEDDVFEQVLEIDLNSMREIGRTLKRIEA